MALTVVPAFQQDDFILTLPDDDSVPLASEDEDNRSRTAEVRSHLIHGKKRKRNRDLDTTKASDGRAKKHKPADDRFTDGGFKAKKGAAVSDGVEDVQLEDDGAIDSDFEFLAGDTTTGVLDDFDGWEDHDIVKRSGNDNPKAASGIDEIIARRRGLQSEKKDDSSEKRSAHDGDAQDEEEDGSLEPNDFDDGQGTDDELLAEDAFGMGAVAESDSEAGSALVTAGHDDDDDDGDDGGHSSDQESVASPVPHPDDLVSETSTGDEHENTFAEEARWKEFFASEDQILDKPQLLKKGDAATFQTMSLSRPILRGLAAVGFSEPTPIQAKTIPIALLGKDVVGGAVTGSGKTAAFLVPIIERLLYRPKRIPTSRVAILMPTRELAVQCHNVAKKLALYTDITFCRLVGGFSLREQESELKKRPDVIIATPGRFIDHMRNSASFTLDTLEILVLDEADRMLEDGFADELNEILTTIPKSRQTMLFSATMTDSVDKLIRLGMTKPVRLMLDAKKQTVKTLVQEFVRLRPGREDKRLGYLMHLCDAVYIGRVIIFFRQKKEAHRVRIVFGLLGLKAAELHGSMTQEQRIRSVESFRDGQVSFLLATDLASRGLDIKGVETVINYEAPQSHEIYLHRVGRTARAGRSGRACTLAAEADRKVVKAAVRAAKEQGAKIVSRVIDAATADAWAEKVQKLQETVEEILKEEKQEKQLAQAEMQLTRGENLIVHKDDIMARPKRTWFESEKEKRAAKKLGRIELNGAEAVGKGKEKKRLSGKEKKRLEDRDTRREGHMWKKTGKPEPKNARGTGKSKKSKTGKPLRKGNHTSKKR